MDKIFWMFSWGTRWIRQRERGAAREDEDFSAAGIMDLASGLWVWPAGSESVAESSTGEPQRFAGILNKLRGLPSLALAEVCLCNNDKAPEE